MRVFLKKRVVSAFAVVALLAVAGMALAYWTQPGGGAATGAVGTPGVITLTGSAAAGIVPGGTEPVTVNVSNPGTSPVKIQTVHLVSFAVDSLHSGCLLADFAMADVTENQSVAIGASNVPLATAGTLSYANTAVSQDACMGATLTLSLSNT